MRKKIGLGVLLGLGIAAGVVAWNTATFKPAGLASADDIKLADAIDPDLNAAANRLGEAIRFQTVSNQDPAQNRMDQWSGFQSWLQTTYPAAHKAMQREIVGKATLLYTWPGSDSALPPIILMAHQDVVPVTPGTEKDWKHPPFGGVVADGAVWGRGAIDDKGSLITLFEAMELLAAKGFKPKRTVIVVAGHDEEVGGTGAQAAAAVLKTRGVNSLFTLDEGSAIINDAPIVNGPAIMIAVAEKGYATLRVTAKAAGGHSSMPPEEIGTVTLAKAITAIHAKQFPARLEQPGFGTVEALAAEKGGLMKVVAANPWLFGSLIKSQMGSTPAGAAQLHTTIAPTMLQGSPKENVLPQEAFGLVNYRLAPWDRSADVLARVKEAVGNLPVTFAWERVPVEASPVSSTSSQGWKLIRAAAEAEAPGAPVAPFLVVGGTDSRYMKDVSQDTYRFQAMRLSTTETKMIHGTNEHITTENLRSMIRFFTRLIATSAS
ncbi:M20 family peptidase [Novosphingobium ginsenosidimutans]|uniref:M20 family peptidase n=1 Tax=Novosphingobium ginsenosidimutans TaxID=1176536 RepID=A0A5B8S6T6_9SPHN|nr:M20 family peptidase [Novosphingobium ginsenosidimutans]QEA16838.1 M20 family peptidase [Novosphingobium ginsenosidimutans]